MLAVQQAALCGARETPSSTSTRWPTPWSKRPRPSGSRSSGFSLGTAVAVHRSLAEGVPGAEYAEIKAGHVFMAEQPDAWHGLVLDFLDRHGL